MLKESLFAAEEREAKPDKLQLLEEHVDFAALAAEIDRAAPRPSPAKGGRPPFPTIVMVKALFLQQLYNLSDGQLEFQLPDRLSFQRFAGLRRSSQIPGRTTFWTFRERLRSAGAAEAIFAAVGRELSRHGYIARCGQVVDASLVPALVRHNRKEEQDLIKQDATPAGWKPAKRRQKDADATWTKKHGKSHFSYKLSANVDRRCKLIRKIKVSTASEHDTRHLEVVLDPASTSRDVDLDKGYVDAGREARLKQDGWRLHIQRKAPRGKPLSACQKRRNTRIARTRARVGHVFAALRQMGGKGLRTIGIARANLQLHWKAAAYNLRRLCSLKECGVPAF